MKICYQNVKNNYTFIPSPRPHPSNQLSRQVLSQPFVPSPITQLRSIFRSSTPLKTWKNLRFLKFLVVREKNIDSKRAIHRKAVPSRAKKNPKLV